MTLAARLDDFEVTLEHLLMDVFVSNGVCIPRVFPATPEVLSTVVSDTSNSVSKFHTCHFVLSHVSWRKERSDLQSS